MRKFQPTVCPTCTQTKDYALTLDRGTAMIVLALYNRVRDLDRNHVHVQKEMEAKVSEFAGNYRTMVAGGRMTSSMRSNVSHARFHGLVAFSTEPGYYLITPKGARFLRGDPVPRVAVIDKTTGHKAYYLDEKDTVTFAELMKRETPFWQLDRGHLDRLAGDSATAEPQLQLL